MIFRVSSDTSDLMLKKLKGKHDKEEEGDRKIDNEIKDEGVDEKVRGGWGGKMNIWSEGERERGEIENERERMRE